ncbi:helix-turn-helix domain-containing protein [Lederbergia graminis]|uniref:Helix-turn-helix domain-containing protein n=1 Tax=Lederbergia graminis TaxID=735518 RepID=A0ABW0LMA1_9BACI
MMNIQGVYHDVNPTWSIKNDQGCDTLVFVCEGKVVYWINNERLELKKGDILYIPFSMERAWENHPEELHQKYTVVFFWEDLELKNALNFTKQNNIFHFNTHNAAYVEQRFSKLFTQFLAKRVYYEQMSSHILSELLTLLAQESSEQRTSPARELIARKIQEYILANFRKNITIEELADLAGVTPNYISVIFKEVVGYTPIQYLHQLRINTAINLLKNTSMTIHEIAEYLGYYDQSYFNRMFKKWMGTNPSHFV